MVYSIARLCYTRPATAPLTNCRGRRGSNVYGGLARRMKTCAVMGLEGVIMKRKGSIYRPGFRSPDWLKVSTRHREEFVVGGYLPSPRGFSTLILGQFNREGNFAYAGSAATASPRRRA